MEHFFSVADLYENNQDVDDADDSHADAQQRDAIPTADQCLTLFMTFILKHKLSGVAITDLLTIMNTLLPGCVPNTKYFIEKEFFSLSENTKVMFYCNSCMCALGENPVEVCRECEEVFDKESNLKMGISSCVFH